jgi:PRC-barrel domain
MHTSRLAVASLAIALATSIASAQQPTDAPPPAQTETELVGLPVYSADGQKLGRIINAATSYDRAAVVAEMGEFLGIGTTNVVIDPGLFQRKVDRIELSMTAAEVKDTISKQRQQKH